MPEAQGDDITGRVRQAVREETTSPFAAIERRFRSTKAILAVVGCVAGAGFVTAIYLNRFAIASETTAKLEVQSQQLTITDTRFAAHAAGEGARLDELQRRQMRVERTVDWIGQQLVEVAKSTNAKKIPKKQED